MEEIWKDVVDYEGYYQVSNLGRARGLDRKVRCGTRIYSVVGRILKHRLTVDGYPYIGLSKEGPRKYMKIHRLVADAFGISKESHHVQLDHINNIRDDNRLENLQWVTSGENNTKRSLCKKKTSKYCGVHYRKDSQKWAATILYNRKKAYLGIFKTEEDAYKAILKYEKDNGIINRFR